jgi:uncharacterized protein YkwD
MREWALSLGLVVACGGAPQRTTDPSALPAPTSAAPAVSAASGSPPDPPPNGMLTLDEARKYMLKLVNADRASMGLPPIALDVGPGQKAAQGHADDMAGNGFLGHWGTDGSVPEQRYSDAGGSDMVLENASCYVDEKPRTLDRVARIDPANIERAEQMFFHETPPHDGHRKNILRPYHSKVGIGIAQPIATETEIPVPCFSQEFVDAYGTYTPIPKLAKVGSTLHVEGTLDAPASVGGIGVVRIDPPRKLTAREANTAERRAYPVPKPTTLYWPPGYKTPIPLVVDGRHFTIDIPVADGSGMYELSVWARMPGSDEPTMIGLRTFRAQ